MILSRSVIVFLAICLLGPSVIAAEKVSATIRVTARVEAALGVAKAGLSDYSPWEEADERGRLLVLGPSGGMIILTVSSDHKTSVSYTFEPQSDSVGVAMKVYSLEKDILSGAEPGEYTITVIGTEN